MNQEPSGSRFPIATSPKNIKTVLPHKSVKISEIIKPRDNGPSALSASNLADELQKEKVERKVERFFSLSTIGFFIWVGTAIALNSPWLSTLSFVFFLAVVIAMADWLEVRWIQENLQTLLNFITKKSASKLDQPKEP